jgi:soluble lytic murein transglycosylase-like protein
MKSPFDAEFNQIRERINFYADKYAINRATAIWQIWQESKFNPRASSGKAHGIAQFTPATAARFGVNVWDVESSLNGWAKYMRFLLDLFGGVYSLALAGYNAGEGAVKKYGNQIPPFAETKNYVKTILGNVSGGGDGVAASSGGAPKPDGGLSTGAIIFGLLFVYLILE